MVPPYAIHLRYTTAIPKRTHFYHFNGGRMAVSLHTRVLQTKVRYQKKRKTRWSFRRYVIQPSNSTTATIRTKRGYFPHSVGYFPTKKTETIDLETVVAISGRKKCV